MTDQLDTTGAVSAYLNDTWAQGAKVGMASALGSNPDFEAELQQVARRTGVPVDSVRSNPDEVKRQAQLSSMDFNALAQQFPRTAAMLADTNKARVSHDDVGNLTAIERAIREHGQIAPVERSFLQGITEPVQRGLAQGRRGLTMLLGGMDPLGLQRQRDAARAAAGLAPEGNAQMAVTLANQQRQVDRFPIPDNVARGMQEISGASTMGYALQAALNNPRAVLEVTLESLGASAPALAGAVAGSTAGPLGTAAGAGMGSFAVEYASTLQDVMAEKGVNPSDALAISNALNNPELMAAAREKALKRGIPIAAFDALTAGVAGRLLAGAKPTVASVGGRAAGELAVQAGGGAAGEATAQAATGEYKPGDILMEALAELPSAVIEVPSNYRASMESAQRTEQQTKFLQGLEDLAKASKVRERDTSTFEAFVAQAAEGGPVQDVFINAQALMQSGVAEQVVAASPAVAAQLQEALVTGGDIRIPVAEYTARIAGSEYSQGLLDHLKTEPGGMSRAEAQEFMQSHSEELQRQVEQALQAKQGDEVFKASADTVKADIKAQLDTVGRFTGGVNDAYASMVGNFYAVMAAKLGTTPDALFAQYPLRVQAEGVGGGEVLSQGRVKGGKYATLPTIKQFSDLRIRRGSENEKVQADSAYADEPSGFLSGVREVRLDELILPNEDFYKSPKETERIAKLAEDIKKNGYITPVLVTEGSQSKTLRLSEGQHRARALRLLGYESVPARVALPIAYFEKSPKEFESNQQLNQSQPLPATIEIDGKQRPTVNERDLMVTHNLTAANLLHADKMGGLPVPSLAITKKDTPLTGFGEITLIGPPEMADPKGYASTKVFGADIYSPRYPTVERELDSKAWTAFRKKFEPMADETGTSLPDRTEVERRGVEQLDTNIAVMGQFLRDQGIKPEIVMRKGIADDRRARLEQFGLGPWMDRTSIFDLIDDAQFVDAAVAETIATYEEKGIAEKRPGMMTQLREDAETRRNFARSLANEIVADAKLRARPEADRYETQRALKEQIDSADLSAAFTDYVAQQLEAITKSERIFQGFTNSGNRKYAPHTLENVVKILKKELRGGESFNYGVGSLRAKFTPEFKSVAQIKKGKDRLVSAEQFEVVKKEIDAEFESVRKAIDPDLSNDTTIGILEDAAKMGVQRAAKSYGYDVSDDAAVKAAEFMTRLRNLPTAYFEAKILRDVSLSEFKAAVVPADLDPKALDALRKAGVTDIRTYTKGDEADRAAKIGEFQDLFFQNRGGNRGSFSPSTNTITLLKAADLSTFLHESGHFFLEVMVDVASRPDAPTDVQKDIGALLKWFGVTDLTEWHSLDFEQKRGYHEQFARGFEAYLFEGKAPSLEMHGLFQRFRAWLVNIYKELKALNVELTDEVRGVFDRMLATSEEIQLAEQGRSMMPLFASPDQAGMTPEEFKAYHDLGVQATADAIEDLQARTLRDMAYSRNARSREIKRLQKEAAARREEVRIEVRREVMSQPVYRAWQFLTSKGDEQNPGGKINTDALNGLGIPVEITKLIQNLRMTSPDGLHPDVVAEMFGFTSGDELVRALAAAQPPKEEIEGLTDARMLEQYGELATPEAIERAADKAIHNDTRARFVATEANALAKAAGQRKVLASAARDFARQMVARLKVRDIRPVQYANAEVRAAKAAQKASQSGDLATAAAEKRNQLVNNYATRAAYDAQDEVDAGVRYLKKFDSDGVRKGLDIDYVEQIDALLERFDLRKGTSLTIIDKRKSLVAWVESQREQGLEPDIPDGMLDEARRQSYKELTVEEFRGLVDSVKQIEHLGRLKHRLLTAKEQKALDAIKAEIVDSINANANGRQADTRTPTTNMGRAMQSLKQFYTSHLKAATLARVMDGGKDGGPMWEYFVRSANERGDMETTMRAEATRALSEIMAPVFKLGRMGGKGQFFPTINRSLNRESRIAIALNTGNEGNLQRLLGGEGWTVAQIQPVLQSLTADEWRAVQAVWDHFESYRPKIAAKERRVYGKEPAWVEPTPFAVTTADGEQITVKGGYYPIKYDPAASQRAEEHADAEGAKRQLQGAYTSATTRRSFTKTRAEEVSGRPLLYTLAGMYSGVNDVIHDLAWHEWLIDVNRLMRSKSIDTAIRTTYGPEVKQQFKTWINDVAEGDKGPANAGEMALSKLRQSVSIAGLGFNVMSAAMQPLGFTQSIVRVGAGWVGKGIAEYLASPIAAARSVNERSDFMANRSRTRFRELNELRNRVQDQSAFDEFVQAGAFFMMMRMQQIVDVPTWLGAHAKAIAEGNTEERARALADQAVIDAQGGGQTKDLSAIERGGPALKLFTVFYSFMNTAMNLGVSRGMTERNKAKLAVDMLLLYTVPAVLGYALKQALTPGDDDLDDPEKLAKQLLAAQIDYLMGMMVVAREFAEAAKTLTGANDKGRDYTGPAGLRMVTDVGTFAKQAHQGEFDDAFRKASVNLVGDLFGLPSAQINRSITGTQALIEGETDNPAAVVFGFQTQ